MAEALGTMKNWREIALENCRFTISAAIKINFLKLVSKLICPTLLIN
jgi:hypothetical protein